MGIAEDAYMCLSYRVWYIIFASLFLVCIIFMISAWVVEDWVERTSDDMEFTGSLTHCLDEDYLKEYKWDTDKFGWDCLAGWTCDYLTSNHGQCEMHADLRDAGLLFTGFMIIVMFDMIMWLQVVVHGIFNIDYGIPVLNYAYITHACAVYITAVLAWFDRSEASFDAD